MSDRESVEPEAQVKPWERLPGETSKQFNAFEIYRQLPPHQRGAKAVASKLGLKSTRRLASWRSQNRWVERAAEWDGWRQRVAVNEDRAAMREMSKRHVGIADRLMNIAYMHLEQQRKTLAGLVANGEALTYLKPKELITWVREGARIEAEARLRNLDASSALSAAGATGLSAADAWRARYVEPERTFVPHPEQRKLIHSTARFSAAVAGVQSGKTAGTGIAFWRRILDERGKLQAKGETGFYWLIAPNSLVGEVMCETFVRFAPEGEIVNTRGRGSGMTWTLRDGSRVQFRSAERADTLVARRLHGAWLDEFTLLKKDIWVTSVRQRLITTGGWALFSGTPRGKNWAFEEIWRRCVTSDDKHDPDYEGFTWWSEENPMVTADEIAAAKRQLPAAYFEREYRASWESFHGQIYEAWAESRMFVPGLREKRFPVGTKFLMGVDWGMGAPGAAVVVAVLPGGKVLVLEEIHQAGKLPAWWDSKITELWAKWKVDLIYCDPEDPGRIGTLSSLGLPAIKASNAVHPGIREVAAKIQQGLFYIDQRCPIAAQQIASYHWKEDSHGNRREEPVKENDHLCDAIRYVLYSMLSQVFSVERSGYGGA